MIPVWALLASQAAAARLVRGPYLEGVSRRSAYVCWRTDVPAAGRVELIDPKHGRRQVEDSKPVAQRCLEAVRSGPASYRVGVSEDGARWAWSSTHPLPAPAPPEATIRFAAFGDSGMGTEGQEQVARHLASDAPDFLLLEGDVIYPGGSDADYDAKYFQPYSSFIDRTPVFIAIGNHDYDNLSRSAEEGRRWVIENFFQVHRMPRQLEGGRWREPEAGRTYYSFDWGPAHFVAVDTDQVYPIPAAPRIDPQSPQWRWLRRDLATSRARWKFVFMHIGLYTSGAHGTDPDLVHWLEPLFDKYGVDVVFQGHDHDYERTRPIRDGRQSAEGPVYVTCGIGGATLRPRKSSAPWSAVFASRFGYVSAELSPRRLSLRAIGADGRAFDRWEKVK